MVAQGSSWLFARKRDCPNPSLNTDLSREAAPVHVSPVIELNFSYDSNLQDVTDASFNSILE